MAAGGSLQATPRGTATLYYPLPKDVEFRQGLDQTQANEASRAEHLRKHQLSRSCEYGVKVKVKITQSCLTFCDPMDCSPPGSSVHSILQTIILEWVTVPFSRGSSQPRDRTQVSWTAGGFFIIWATREAWTYFKIKAVLEYFKVLKFFFISFETVIISGKAKICVPPEPWGCNTFGPNPVHRGRDEK